MLLGHRLLSRLIRVGVAMGLLLLGQLSVLPVARADEAATRDALDRLQEVLQLRLEDGRLSADDVMPAVLVSTQARTLGSEAWFTTRAVEVLQAAFGESGLRMCEACMAPRAVVGEGTMTWQAGPVGLDEVVRLDEGSRGSAEPARAAIWLDEAAGGVTIRIVDLRTGRVLFAQNVDPNLVENRRSKRMYTLSAELERRARGDSLTQSFVDITMYPGQHISLDWTDQWGPRNHNLSGVVLSLYDPVIGLGGVHYRTMDAGNITVGGKAILSLPTAIVNGIGDGGEVLDPMLTVVGVVRVPFGRSNYGAIATASTNGEVGIGVSLMNISLIPVIP